MSDLFVCNLSPACSCLSVCHKHGGDCRVTTVASAAMREPNGSLMRASEVEASWNTYAREAREKKTLDDIVRVVLGLNEKTPADDGKKEE